MDLTIRTYWDGSPAPLSEHTQLSLQLDATHLHLDVTAPFEQNPPPQAPAGFCEGLWEFEVVELFLFGANERYLELELGPHAHYLALTFAGIRERASEIRGLKVDSSRNGDTWRGQLQLPREALPAGLYGLNAFAIRGVSEGRRYLALVPTPGEKPDFHRLDCWMPFEG